MERRRAIIASAITATTLTLGAGAYVAGSGLLAGATDTVGNLQPTVTQPTTATPNEITVYVDPATGTATTVAPRSEATTVAPRSEATTVAPLSETPAQPASGGREDGNHGNGEEDD